MFGRKGKVFSKLQPVLRLNQINKKFPTFRIEDKVFFKKYQTGKQIWTDGIVGRVVYLIQDRNGQNERHIDGLHRRDGIEGW